MKKSKGLQLIISLKNSKIGKCGNLSSTPIKDCINCKECSKKCYALKAYRQYKNTKKAWDNNSNILRNHLDIAERDLIIFLDKYKKDFFRWNVAGDIISEEQFSMYKRIAKRYPAIKFLSFTKNYGLNFDDLTDNYSVVLSCWTGMKLPENKTLPRAYVSTDDRKNNTIKCIGHCEGCGMCWSLKEIKKNVCFDIH